MLVIGLHAFSLKSHVLISCISGLARQFSDGAGKAAHRSDTAHADSMHPKYETTRVKSMAVAIRPPFPGALFDTENVAVYWYNFC